MSNEIVEKAILEVFEGKKNTSMFSEFTDEEYMGYIVGVVDMILPELRMTPLDILQEVKKLSSRL